MMNLLKAIYDVVTNSPAIGLGFLFMIVYIFTDKLFKSIIVTSIATIIYFSITDINTVLYIGSQVLLVISLCALCLLFQGTENKALAILYFIGIVFIFIIAYNFDAPNAMFYLLFVILFLLFVLFEKLSNSFSFSFIWATRLSGILLLIYGINVFMNYGTIVMMNIATIIIEKSLSFII